MSNLDIDTYIEEHLFRIAGSRPYRYSVAGAYAMESEIERQGWQWEYLSHLLLILGQWDTEVEPTLFEGSVFHISCAELWRVMHATPLQRATACYEVLRKAEDKTNHSPLDTVTNP